MNSDLENLKSLGKASIIESAFNILRENKQLTVDIIPSDYNISVWANSEKLLVKFIRKLKYIPINTHYVYDLTVDMLTKKVSPFDDWYRCEKDLFYIPSEDDILKIEFVKKHCEVPVAHFDNCIYEEDDSWFIKITNKYAFRKFNMNKLTGEISFEIEGSYHVGPSESFRRVPDPLKEIFDE